MRHGGVVGNKVQAELLREGPEQGSLRVLFLALLGLGFEQLCSHLFILALRAAGSTERAAVAVAEFAS